jgi:alkanesulfonate monooxygenase SsuD/methylene tetrahydromethanopterin reductase-like flavin-dependent oxidoreductase (luciferase family)
MVERSRAHEGDLNQLVDTAEGMARHATALAALTRTDPNADGLSRLCADQARLSVENAAATVRACVGAREQRVEAHRLYRTIDNEPEDPHQIVAKFQRYMDMGIRAFILSGYPHKPECELFARYVLPCLKTGKLNVLQNRVSDTTPRTPLGAGEQ